LQEKLVASCARHAKDYRRLADLLGLDAALTRDALAANQQRARELQTEKQALQERQKQEAWELGAAQQRERQARDDLKAELDQRVNSRRAVRFRQWATCTPRDHLVQGYTLNRQRLEENARELESALALVRKAASGEALTAQDTRAYLAREPSYIVAGTTSLTDRLSFCQPA